MKEYLAVTKKLWFDALVCSVFILVACSGCQGQDRPVPTSLPESITAVISSTPPKPTITPTFTALPTATDVPTSTPEPTRKPVPSPTLTPIPKDVEVFKLSTSDGMTLAAFLRRPPEPADDGLVVVMAHGLTQSHTEWSYLEELLIENGFATLTFDFRGHGESSGAYLPDSIGIDVTTVIAHAQSLGFERIICIGSSLGGMGCLAAVIDTPVSGLVVISSPRTPREVQLVSKSDVQNLTIPKVIMFSENDAWHPELVESYRALAEDAAQPKTVYISEDFGHGSGLLYGQDGDIMLGIIRDFVKDIAR